MPLSRSDAAHLLRRGGFGGTAAEIDAYAGLSVEQAVDQLVEAVPEPAPDPAFLTDPALADWQKHRRAQWWWLDRMRTTPAPLVEKMVLFWHGHFTSAQSKLYDIALLHQQNQLFRRHALGDYRSLAQQVAVDPAMLKYLDNETNRRGRPQENFARELLELFTLGVGHYTQDDVVTMAKAWTGHNLDSDRRTYRFHPERHDTSPSPLFGITRAWDGPEALDEVLLGARAEQAARFITAKLWTFLVGTPPPAPAVEQLAASFRTGGLALGPLVRSILLREEFWAPPARYSLVRSPVEFVVSTLKAVWIDAETAHPEWHMAGMGQVLYDPPNVAGWKQNGYWISTAAFWSRAAWLRYLRWRTRDAGVFADLDTAAPEATVRAMFERFSVLDPSEGTGAALEDWVRAERSAGRSWAIAPNLVLLAGLSPEHNVC